MTQNYEYRTVPAPTRGARFKGLRSSDDAFSLTVTEMMNEQAREGWEYIRSDKLTQSRGIWPFRRSAPGRNLLVFRRAAQRSLERPSSLDVDAAKIRARRARRDDLVALVESGARKIEVRKAEDNMFAAQ